MVMSSGLSQIRLETSNLQQKAWAATRSCGVWKTWAFVGQGWSNERPCPVAWWELSDSRLGLHQFWPSFNPPVSPKPTQLHRSAMLHLWKTSLRYGKLCYSEKKFVVRVNKRISINRRSVTQTPVSLLSVRPPRPPHPHCPSHYIKGALFPALALGLASRCKSRAAESSSTWM